MISDEKTAFQVADNLLQIKAIKLQPESPFTWASGWKSPIYCDNRVILSYPEVRDFIRKQMAQLIRQHYPQAGYIAGVATGAIAMGVLVAQELELPFVYVRPEPKSHGRRNQIEGFLKNGAQVVVIEDLVSTGGSSLKAVEALENSGGKVLGMAAVFTYGFELARDNFSKKGCKLVTLSDYNHLLKEYQRSGAIDKQTFTTLQEWRKNPSQWLVNY